ncbi:MAG: hypothetical protein LBR43_02160 [Spiroplasmataceae bacterium]|jgi:hypothetical protein|nr:hypothetical protein [Spiroplasmataceae bacterium]
MFKLTKNKTTYYQIASFTKTTGCNKYIANNKKGFWEVIYNLKNTTIKRGEI